MIGTYRLRHDGKTYESTNVITFSGRKAILRHLAGETAEWAAAVVLGIGDNPAAASDTRLQFEAARTPINLRLADLSNDSIVFRGVFTDGTIGKIYEVGLVNQAYNPATAETILAYFDPSFEEIEGGVVDVNNYRLSDRSYAVTATAGGTADVLLPVTNIDLSTYNATDVFTLSYTLMDANAVSITLMFLTTAGNYVSHTIQTPDTPGHQFYEWTMADLVTTGIPDLSAINQVGIIVTADASDTTVALDGLKISRQNQMNSVLVSRSVLATPMTKQRNKELEVEYEVKMTW